MDDVILSKQDDFRSQKSGLEEIYENHNKIHGTSHQCKFLLKFHPELNPIERVWSRLKLFLRKYNDGQLATLQLLMKKRLDRENVSLTLTRKYCRLVTAFLLLALVQDWKTEVSQCQYHAAMTYQSKHGAASR
jgi:hypothetical protein